MFRLVMLACVFAAANACNACVSGVCQQRRHLLDGFTATDGMAFDHDSRVLYLLLEYFDITADLEGHDFKIERVQDLNTSITVDQTSGTLYTAHNRTLYGYLKNHTSVKFKNIFRAKPDLLFYNNNMYFTTKFKGGINFIEPTNSTSRVHIYLVKYTITDFVVNKNNKIYFVSDDKLYVYNDTWHHGPELIANKRYVLSVDKFGDVYLGDVTTNGIYKLDESDRLVEYAAYAVGSIDRFVFDHRNNIVFHDAASGSVSYWKPEGTPCKIVPPHDKFIINKVSNNLCDQQQHEQSTMAQDGLNTINYE